MSQFALLGMARLGPHVLLSTVAMSGPRQDAGFGRLQFSSGCLDILLGLTHNGNRAVAIGDNRSVHLALQLATPLAYSRVRGVLGVRGGSYQSMGTLP